MSLNIKLKTVPVLVSLNGVLIQLGIRPRFRSAVLDHLGMTFFLGLLMIPLFVYVVYQTVGTGRQVFLEEKLWAMIYGSLLGSIYLNKDAVLGQSIGKRICDLQVIDRKTKKVASPFKCFIRNIPIMVWPLEVLFLLITKNRRLGDFIANTEVILYNKNRNKKLGYTQIMLSILVGTIITFIYFKLSY